MILTLLTWSIGNAWRLMQPCLIVVADLHQSKPTNERLRRIGGSAKLVLDILEYDPTYERIFQSICG